MVLQPGLEFKGRDHKMIETKFSYVGASLVSFSIILISFFGFPDFLASLQYVYSCAFVLSISLSQVVDAICITNAKAIRRRISNVVNESFYCRVTSSLP